MTRYHLPRALMFDLIAQVLAFFYSLVPSYGVAIVLLTLAVMIVVTPLTLKSTRSMLQMQRLQPELKAIQTRYKDDRQKMNEELMAFYQENGINPLGGVCRSWCSCPSSSSCSGLSKASPGTPPTSDLPGMGCRKCIVGSHRRGATQR